MSIAEHTALKFPETTSFIRWLKGRRANPHEEPAGIKGQDGSKIITVPRQITLSGGRIVVPRQQSNHCAHCHGGRVFWPADAPHCAHCNGSGYRRVAHHGAELTTICDACFGSGWEGASVCGNCQTVYDRQICADPMVVNIPAGFAGCSNLTAPGLGCTGRFGGPAGDLRIFLRVEDT